MTSPSVGNSAGLALLVLNVSGVPGLIKSVGTDTPKQRAIGYGLALAVGGASSVLGRTPWPLLGSAGMCALMLYLQNEASPDYPGKA
jgi:hypothetical protein